MLSASSTPARLPVVILTLAVGLLTFFQLGTLRAPRTYYAARRSGEAVTADLGEIQAMERVCAYVGLGTGSYRLELSADGRTWSPGATVEQETCSAWWSGGRCPCRASARYLRATAERPGLMLGEIAVFGPDRRPSRLPGRALAGNRRPPVGRLPAAQAPYGAALPPGRPEFLFDEPRTAVYTPTHRTGMYFDETYFARSAWEGMLGLAGHGNHPPPAGQAAHGGRAAGFSA